MARLGPLAAAAAILAAVGASGVRLGRSHPHKHEKHESSHHHEHHESRGEEDRQAARPNAAGTSKGGCIAPQPGDKVVYLVRHLVQDLKLGHDPPLVENMRPAAWWLRTSPKLVPAVAGDERHRAQLVLMSPFTRTMETALLGFGGLFLPEQFLLNPDLMEYQVSDVAQKKNGEAMLNRLNATDILQKYRQLPEGWTGSAGDHVERWKNFEDFLRRRPEERFIVVSHHWMMKRAGQSLHYGEVGISAFTPQGEWKVLSEPSCWPDFKEDYKRIMDAREREWHASH